MLKTNIESMLLDRAYAPILKWAGNKQWVGDLLRSLYLAHGESLYVEPMCGGLGSALAVGADNAVLCDYNHDLINLYQQAQIDLAVRDFGDTDVHYYYIRSLWNDRIDRNGEYYAQMMYYLNRRCFRGLYRTNSKGGFNVPVGQPKQQVDPTLVLTLPPQWDFVAQGYEQTFKDYGGYPGFMVVDPPYAETGVKYGSDSFDVTDVLSKIPRSLGVVYFNSDTPQVRLALNLHGFKTYQISEPRSMNAGHGACSKVILIATRGIADSENIMDKHGAIAIDQNKYD